MWKKVTIKLKDVVKNKESIVENSVDNKKILLSKQQENFFKNSKIRKRITNENPTNSNNINESSGSDDKNSIVTGYHGSDYKFTKFRDNGIVWISSDKKYASTYGKNLYECTIDIGNTVFVGELNIYLDYFDEDPTTIIDDTYISDDLIYVAKLVGCDVKDLFDIYVKEGCSRYKSDDGYYLMSDSLYEITNSLYFRDLIIELGYDSVSALEDGIKTYGVVNSDKIKSIKLVSKQKGINESLQENTSKEDIYTDERYLKFKNYVTPIVERKVSMINKELDRFGFEVEYVEDYDFDDMTEDEWVGVFVGEIQDSSDVFPITINIPLLYKDCKEDESIKDDLPYHIEKTLWHEVGHGVFNYLNDFFDLDDLDVEKVVEEYARYQCGEINDCELLDIWYEYRQQEGLEESLVEDDELDNDTWYHGTTYKRYIHEFNQHINWFTTDYDYAKEYATAANGKGYIYKVKLKNYRPIECGETSYPVYNPLSIVRGKLIFSSQFEKIMDLLGLDELHANKLIQQVSEELGNLTKSELYKLKIDVVTRTSAFRELCLGVGFDSILCKEYGSVCCGLFFFDDAQIVGREEV